jgi:hypothetical protein
MRKIITSIILTACVALCATVWPRNAEVEDSVKTAVTAKIETGTEEYPPLIISAENDASEQEPITEIEMIIPSAPQTAQSPEASQSLKPLSKPISPSAPATSEPKPGTIAVIDGVNSMWIPGFGWVKDEGGGSVRITVDGKGDINKQIGVMGGGTTVGNPGDELTGHKVGIMGGGSVAEDMYENGNKIGIMGGDDSHTEKVNPPQPELPEMTGDVIYIELQPPVIKNSTPPDYKPGQ